MNNFRMARQYKQYETEGDFINPKKKLVEFIFTKCSSIKEAERSSEQSL